MAKNPFLAEDPKVQNPTPAPPAEAPVAPAAPAEPSTAEPAAEVVEPNGAEAEIAASEPAVGESAEQTPPSKRDGFRKRVSERYPDLDMEDEDAYYDQMGSMMDDYEGYERSTRKLRDAMSKNDDFAEMMIAARDDENFNPVTWMITERNVDLRDALDDPDFAEKFAEAEQARKEKEAKGKEFFEQMQQNIGPTMEAQYAALEEAGITGEEADRVMERLFDFADSISQGTWDPQIGVLIARGGDFDKAVEDAREEGKAEGLNTKVTDRVRKLRDQQEEVTGTQTPMKPREPEKKNKNMFMA